MRAILFLSLASLSLADTPPDPAALSEQAQKLASVQRMVEAEALWNQALHLSPDYFPALFNLGYAYSREGKLAEAEPLLRRAAEASPDDFNSHYLLGVMRKKLERRDDALRAWREALRIQPNNLRLMQVMSVEYSSGRYFAEAAALAKRSI